MNTRTFAGIRVQPGISRLQYASLSFTTLLIGIAMVMPAVLQPAFLKEVIGVSPAYFGSINSFLSSISQAATLALAGVLGVFSDRVGRTQAPGRAWLCVHIGFLRAPQGRRLLRICARSFDRVLSAPFVKNRGVEAAFYLSAALACTGMLCGFFFLKDHVQARRSAAPRLRDIIPAVRRSRLLQAGYLCALVTRADVVVASTFITTWGVMRSV